MKNILLFCLILLHRLPLRILLRQKKITKSILILKLDAIGDSIIWLDSAKEYRKSFPNHRLVLCYKKDWEEIALKLPYFDAYFPFDQKRFFKRIAYRFSLLKQLNTYHYEKVINPTFSRNFFLQDWIIHNIHAKEKIGSNGDYTNTNNTIAKLTSNFNYYNPKLKKIADKWYTCLLPASSETKMELIRNAEFIRSYINPSFQSQLPIFPFDIIKTSLIPFEKYIVVVLGGSTDKKMWNVDKFAQTALHFMDKFNVVVCGGKEENELFNRFMSFGIPDEKVINLIGKTNLTELISVIKYASITLTNDTAASHITVATHTPSVCILGGGHYGRFQPYQVENIKESELFFLPKIAFYPMDCFGCGLICKYPLENGKWKCINSIEKESAIEKINEIMNFLESKEQVAL